MRTTFWISQDITGNYIDTHYRHTMSNTLKYIYVGAIASYLQTIIDTPIENIKITRTLSIITNTDSHRSKAFDFFYNELWLLKNL